jgi:hypothetical protein
MVRHPAGPNGMLADRRLERKARVSAGETGGIGFAMTGIIGSTSGGAVSRGHPEQPRRFHDPGGRPT